MANRHPDDARFLQTRLWRDHLQPRHLHMEPLCRSCKAKGRITVAEQVDHIIVPNGNGIQQRDPSNHQSLCAPATASRPTPAPGIDVPHEITLRERQFRASRRGTAAGRQILGHFLMPEAVPCLKTNE